MPMFVELIPKAVVVVAVVVSMGVALVAMFGVGEFIEVAVLVECVVVAFEVSLDVLVSLRVSSEVFMLLS